MVRGPHGASGVAHNPVADDAAALALVRRYLAYFPSNAWEHPPRPPTGRRRGPRAPRRVVELVPADPRRAYDVRSVIELVCRRAIGARAAARVRPAIVTALARLGGHAVAVVANQPAVKAGSIDADAADKAAHFLDVADAFHLPVVFLADNPGVLAGTAADERHPAHAAAMFAAQTGCGHRSCT